MMRPAHDLALIRPRPDLHAKLHGIPLDSRGSDVKTGNPYIYKVTAARDKFAFGEVVALGNGTPYGSGRDRPEVLTGTIVGFDLGQVGHVLPNGLYTLMWKNMLCSVREELDIFPRPLCSQVMTEPDDVAMGRLVFNRSNLILPRMTTSGGVATNDARKTSVRLRAERVLDVGPGEFVRKVFYEAGCKKRDIACYTPGGTVHLTWREGRRLAFTPWSEIVVVIDGG
jgi:hypothetical protein